MFLGLGFSRIHPLGILQARWICVLGYLMNIEKSSAMMSSDVLPHSYPSGIPTAHMSGLILLVITTCSSTVLSSFFFFF